MMFQIGQKIRALRQVRGITQEELARQLGITAQAVSRWENETSLPAIAYFFDTSIDALFACRAEEAEAEVAAIQKAFYRVMDSDPEEAERILREGLKKYPGNEDLLVNLLWCLRAQERYEERVALCRRLAKSSREEVRFRAKCTLAKSYRCQGHYELAKQLVMELPYYESTALEMQAKLLEGVEGFQAAQREKVSSLARLLDMLRILAEHYSRRGEQAHVLDMVQMAQNVLEAFRADVPYRFPANEAPTQTYEMFEQERRQLAELAAQYQQ